MGCSRGGRDLPRLTQKRGLWHDKERASLSSGTHRTGEPKRSPALNNLSRAVCAQPFPVLKFTVTGKDLSYFTPELHIISFPFLPQCSHDQFPALLLIQGSLNTLRVLLSTASCPHQPPYTSLPPATDSINAKVCCTTHPPSLIWREVIFGTKESFLIMRLILQCP